VAFGDVDNDGDQDLFVNMGGAFTGDLAYPVLFENPGNANRWVRLRLAGRRSNRSAIGARVAFHVTTADGPRDYHALVGTGSSFGANSLWLEQGLGQATGLETVTVTWPAGGVPVRYTGLALDTAWLLREGEAAPTPQPMQRMDRPAPGTARPGGPGPVPADAAGPDRARG
jgi:hypothetical protein